MNHLFYVWCADENDTSFILKVDDEPLRDLPLKVDQSTRKVAEDAEDWNDNVSLNYVYI